MEPSKVAFDMIKHQEGLPAPGPDGKYHAYHGKADKAGVWTIGYGMTWYPKGAAVRESDTITKFEVENMMNWHINRFADMLDSHLPKTLKLEQYQFDALEDFLYNEGEKNLFTSTLWQKLLINPNDPTIYLYGSTQKKTPVIKSCEFLKWVYANGKVVDDLIWRRASEAILYSTGRVDYLGH